MQTKRNNNETGNVLICVLGAILILSLIGANVLQSSATRLNASVNHVRAWKESLSAAESGGDVAFAEIRKHKTDPPTGWPWTGWTQSVSGSRHTYTSPATTFGASNLQTQTVVDECYFDSATNLLVVARPASANTYTWFRLRSKGTAPLPGLKRSGMDDALIQDSTKHFADFGSTEMQDITARGKGDSLLRKIDFDVDHFVATYGPEGDGLNKAVVPPIAAPSISRRIEQLVQPATPFFDAAIKANGSFYGLGSASFIDSYDSRNGNYDITVKDNPSSPWFGDSRHGNVQINNATASVKGSIYGDVATNGGNVTSGNPGIVYGTIDNNVPFTLENFSMPNTGAWNYVATPTNVSGPTTITPAGAGDKDHPYYYLVSSIGNVLTINPAVVSGSPVETYVAIHVTGDISGGSSGIIVNPLVKARIYFDGNIDMKTQNINNQNPSAANPFAGNLQFYGISPVSGTQSVQLDSGGGQPILAATFYAPSADVQIKGAPDFFGTVTAKSFYANGNITWHYDRALNDIGEVLDYKIASYIEDTR